VAINPTAAVAFMVGFVMFGIALTRTATLPGASGVLLAVGAPMHLLGAGLAQLLLLPRPPDIPDPAGRKHRDKALRCWNGRGRTTARA